jgi:hypothetical protein
MEKPTREKPHFIGHIDFDFIESMIEYNKLTGSEIDLKDFSYAEIQVHPLLYKEYIKGFNIQNTI